jgi:hypothetical protein
MRGLRISIIAFGFLLVGCSISANHAKGVYVLIAVEGVADASLEKARAGVNYLLTTLQPNDTLGIARIDTGSFNEKNIIAALTFDQRPSVVIRQKRIVKARLDEFAAHASGGTTADISGGILHAIEYLNAAGCRQKYILLFSDLKATRHQDYRQEIFFQLSGFTVIAFEPDSPPSPGRPAIDPERVEKWRRKVEGDSGKWQTVKDIAALTGILEN